MRYRLGKGVQEARRLQLTHPQPWQWLCFPGGNSEPKNSSVGTGLGKNSSVGHIPASLAARHQRAHVEPHCREGTGQGAGRRWTQTEPGAGEKPGCCLGEAELVSGGVRGGGAGRGRTPLSQSQPVHCPGRVIGLLTVPLALPHRKQKMKELTRGCQGPQVQREGTGLPGLGSPSRSGSATRPGTAAAE